MTIKIGVIQQECSACREDNVTVTIEAIYKARNSGVELVLLQELHTHLYFCQTENVALFDLAETIPGPTTKMLGEVACECHMVIVASLFEKRAVGLYHNTAVVIEKNGEIAGCYRKMHIPDDPGFYEKFYFTPGDLGFCPIKTSVGNLGVLICWDQWYPEAARLMALKGADILLYPTAIGWGTQEMPDVKKYQREAWQIIQRSHAVANGLPVVVANRVGLERALPDSELGIVFWGGSFIAGAQGEILVEASQDKPEMIVAEIDLNQNEIVRRGWPFLRDRRIDAYQGLMKRFVDVGECLYVSGSVRLLPLTCDG